MNRAAVLGSPIAHSLSPVLHTAAYAALGLTDWTYAAHQVEADDLTRFVGGLDETWRGLSLTMPLKEAAIAAATSVSEVAAAAGAANTLVRRPDDGWDADNTDVVGMVRTLADVDHQGRATVLGAGATARSAILALRDLAVRDVLVAARRPDALAEIKAWAGQAAPEVAVAGVTLERWADEPRRLVVSTLPSEPSAAVADSLDESGSGVWEGGTLLDVVYAEWPTPLARRAAAYRIRTVSGVDLLVHQAAEQFRLFTGREPPMAAMFAVVEDRR